MYFMSRPFVDAGTKQGPCYDRREAKQFYVTCVVFDVAAGEPP